MKQTPPEEQKELAAELWRWGWSRVLDLGQLALDSTRFSGKL